MKEYARDPMGLFWISQQSTPPVDLKRNAAKLASCKTSAAVITQMFLSLQTRPESDLSDFFRYENSRFPPAISDRGKLRSGTKSQILDCFPGMSQRGPILQQRTPLS